MGALKKYVPTISTDNNSLFLKPRKPSTNPQLRSLLQKAVRRGFSNVVASVLARLEKIGDKAWVRSRSAVVAAEECWPLIGDLDPRSIVPDRVNWFVRISETEKYKDAAGLGTLAYAASENDSSVFDGTEDDRTIKIIAEAIKRPADYWNWIIEQSRNKEIGWNIQKIQSFVPWATWPWDKAFIIASAYLRLIAVAPLQAKRVGPTTDEFPYWVAIDKHTDEGKLALRSVAKQLGCPYRRLNWVSYYYESAKVNSLSESPWWEKEKRWRLSRVGLTPIEAEEFWHSASTLFASAVGNEAEKLKANLVGQVSSELLL